MKREIQLITLILLLLNGVLLSFAFCVYVLTSIPDLHRPNETILYRQAYSVFNHECSLSSNSDRCYCVTKYVLDNKLPSEILEMQATYFETSELDPIFFSALEHCSDGGVTVE